MLCELEEAQLNTTVSRSNYRHHESPSNVQILIFIFERSARLVVFDLGKRFENTFWAVRFALAALAALAALWQPEQPNLAKGP